MKKRLALILVVMPLLVACATNPVTGKSELSLIPEPQEIAMGQQGAEQIISQMGLYPDEGLQTYVSDLGMEMARGSERPHLPWKFYVLDDTSVNAFALPGGSIFVTRGILTHMNSESELVGVLGHEIGHVTAKHSVSQMSKAQLAQIGLTIGVIAKPEWAEYFAIGGIGMQFLFLKFGRDDERQSDDLGFRYMVEMGYDARGMASMFTTLGRYGSHQGGGRTPEWASTHPDPANRVAVTNMRIASLAGDPRDLKVNRQAFLDQIDGITFGPNPRHGYFQEERFIQPEMKFMLSFPRGWKTINQPQAVIGISPSEDAIVELSVLGEETPRTYADEFFGQEAVEAGQTSAKRINGLDAFRGYFNATTQSGRMSGVVTWVALAGSTYQLLSYTSETKLSGYDDEFVGVSASFARLRDRDALAVQPARMKLVKLDRAMTLREFNRRYPSSISIEELALINAVAADGSFEKGAVVKRVVGGELPRGR